MVSNGRDPQRLFTAAQRAEIAARQHHRCEVCREQLPAVFHIHHKVSWASGGRTHPGNGMAVCPGCHAIAPVVKLTDFTPREWQAEALPYILPILRGGAFATASAAPGAGKTFFGGWCYQQLAATDDYARMVWFVPNGSLRKQVRDELESMGIYLDTESVTERPGRDGVVLTYHTLSDPAKLEQIIRDADQAPTLFTLDEVHHLAIEKAGKAGMWAWGISRITGTVDRPLHPVLNMSGTLFRSDESERISTIRYRKGLDGSQIETLADYEVNAGRLIREGHLRHIKVLAYDAEMTVQAVDLAKEATGDATIRAVDLDGDRRLQSAVAAALVRDPAFIDGIVAELGTRLGHASAALHGYPVKGLIVVDSKDHADQVYMRAVEQLGTRHVFVAHGDIKSADDEIERFRKSGDQAVLVAVRKVSEGFERQGGMRPCLPRHLARPAVHQPGRRAGHAGHPARAGTVEDSGDHLDPQHRRAQSCVRRYPGRRPARPRSPAGAMRTMRTGPVRMPAGAQAPPGQDLSTVRHALAALRLHLRQLRPDPGGRLQVPGKMGISVRPLRPQALHLHERARTAAGCRGAQRPRAQPYQRRWPRRGPRHSRRRTRAGRSRRAGRHPR